MNIQKGLRKMKKCVTVQWKPFFEGEVKDVKQVKGYILQSASTGMMMAVAAVANETTNGSWLRLLNALWNISDWICIGVIMFAGASWMFGNRTKAIELLTGGAIGYLVIKHSVDIQKFLSAI
jgi:hypothetical protein